MIEVLTDIMERIVRLEQRVANVVQHGPVHEVDPKAQKARIRLGGTDEEPYLSAWVPYAQMGGAFKGHVPVSKGQNMTLIAPGGVPEQAFAAPMTFNDANKSPSEKGDENVWTFGDVRVELRGKQTLIKLGSKTTITINGDDVQVTTPTTKIKSNVNIEGNVAIKGTVNSTGDFAHTGGTLTHDGKNIGSTHKHTGVQPGGGLSDVPA